MPGLGIDFDNRVLIHVIPEGVQTLVSSSSRKPLAKINMMWSRVPNYWCRPRGSSGGSRALWNQGDGWKIFFVLITVTSHSAGSLPNTIKIGGLFDMSDSVEEISFRYAVDRVNGDRDILPNSRLTAQIDRIQPEDSFYASKQVCRDLQMGIAGVFGPQSGVTASHVQSICDALEVPHIETRWDYRLVREDYSVNLHPYPQALGQAYADMVTAMNWKSCLILYEESEGLVRLQEVLKLSPKRLDIKIQIRQLDPGPGGDHRPLLKDIKQLGENRIILDCKNDHVQEILKQAQQVGIMTAYHTFFITTLDLHLVELEELKYGGTNITAFRLVDPDLEEVQNMIEDIKFEGGRGGRKTSDLNRSTIRPNSTIHPFAIGTETALIFDAVHLFSRALTDLDRSQELSQVSLNCDGPGTWQYGNSLINYMKMVEMNGLTGKIQFDSRGFRSDFDLDIVELKKEGLSRVGRWNRGAGANFTRNFTESYSEIIESLHNKTLVVTTILAEPYTMYKENSAVLSGNEQFEGYSVDLVDAISKILGFNYSFRLVEDGKHGSYNKDTGTWNGMVGELLSQKADLAVGDLTITYEREQGVDFTMPFMNLGVTILFTKPTAKDPNLFSFLSPLSLGVWIYMATAYLAVSLLLYLLARISPYERGVDALIVSRSDNKGCRLARSDPIYDTLFSGNGRVVRTIGTQVEDREDDHDVFTLMNSFWFMIASLLQQGTDLLPRAISTRMVAGMWWFFTLIMISSYTANLAAFLTVERMDSPIESAEDLSKQHSIKYGCLQGGSTAGFFSDSKIDTYSRMWVFMSSDKSNFVSSNALGVDRVLKENGKYAFLMESTSVEYVIERNCKLTQIGGLMDSKGYGIALPPNSPFRTPISSAILQLQEGGKLHMLKEKWWKQRKGGGKCKEVKDKEANELNLKNVGGVFLVLMMGLVLACFIACLERCWKNRKPRYDQMPGVSHSGGHLSTCTNDTSENLGCHEGLPVRFENGHINHNHLDLAGHAPNCHSSGLTGSMGHIPPNIMADTGGFLTSSLSAASLNQPSCAVPMHEHHRPSSSVTSTPGGGSGWAMMTNSNGGSRHVVSHRHHQHHHQEQCPHYNGAEYKFHEAPS
ncbi:glutamate receptor ionotropic, kainate 2-like [Tigriopus californicus]|uniref:glutamate receptor ionotropic, kainate 2-like n=1 Tax=Tigriopus californicus TaxID=6832 RepID=UPI0027DA4B1B|nr:glutamate receptor ionotropic, kainate 2-like [Tigriopus californicus]